MLAVVYFTRSNGLKIKNSLPVDHLGLDIDSNCQARSVQTDEYIKSFKSIRMREGWREGGNPREGCNRLVWDKSNAILHDDVEKNLELA